ncbi:hypothetical protein [Dactylosporangium sp. NPDC051484]|uniref:hypothetical protein n=1 Tax=Dactylosporangium sp. NPDC051484 TaxID=3154942 RepID=UPI0034509178
MGRDLRIGLLTLLLVCPVGSRQPTLPIGLRGGVLGLRELEPGLGSRTSCSGWPEEKAELPPIRRRHRGPECAGGERREPKRFLQACEVHMLVHGQRSPQQIVELLQL